MTMPSCGTACNHKDVCEVVDFALSPTIPCLAAPESAYHCRALCDAVATENELWLLRWDRHLVRVLEAELHDAAIKSPQCWSQVHAHS
jgi:hypothetical protein